MKKRGERHVKKSFRKTETKSKTRRITKDKLKLTYRFVTGDSDSWSGLLRGISSLSRTGCPLLTLKSCLKVNKHVLRVSFIKKKF